MRVLVFKGTAYFEMSDST